MSELPYEFYRVHADTFVSVPFELNPASLFLQISDEQGIPVDERTFADLSAVEHGIIIGMIGVTFHIPVDQLLKEERITHKTLREARHSTHLQDVVLDESIDENCQVPDKLDRMSFSKRKRSHFEN